MHPSLQAVFSFLIRTAALCSHIYLNEGFLRMPHTLSSTQPPGFEENATGGEEQDDPDSSKGIMEVYVCIYNDSASTHVDPCLDLRHGCWSHHAYRIDILGLHF